MPSVSRCLGCRQAGHSLIHRTPARSAGFTHRLVSFFSCTLCSECPGTLFSGKRKWPPLLGDRSNRNAIMGAQAGNRPMLKHTLVTSTRKGCWWLSDWLADRGNLWVTCSEQTCGMWVKAFQKFYWNRNTEFGLWLFTSAQTAPTPISSI